MAAGRVATLLVAATLTTACGGRPLRRADEVTDGASTEASDSAPDRAFDDASDGVSDDTDGAADAPLACVPGQEGGPLVGSIDHRSIRLSVTGSASLGFPVLQSSWSILKAASSSQARLAWGQGDADGGLQHDAGALIVVPDEMPPGATYYCAARVEATATTSGDVEPAVELDLSELSELGRCPGSAVSGTVSVCIGTGRSGDGGVDGCPFDSFLVSGAIEGVAIDLGYLGGTVYAGDVGAGVGIAVVGSGNSNDAGVILLDSQMDGSVAGWIRIPNGDAPNAGVVYCLENGRARKEADQLYKVTFDSVGRLGTCPGTPVEGALAFCR
jgi:hypothetical protein